MTPDPGWYPDPDNSSRARYWDGSTWTDQTRELDRLEAPPSGPEGAAAEAPTPLQRDGPRRVLPVAAGVVVVVALGVGAGVFLASRGDEDGEPVGETPATPATETATEEEGAPPGPASDEPGSTGFERYTPSNPAFSYEAVLPSGAGWSEPQESEPTEGELLRTTVRGPGGLLVLVDRTPSEVPTLTTSFDSRETVPHPAFGTAERYVISDSELIPECRGSPCVDYLIDDGEGGGWAVLAGGGGDLALADTVAKRIADSLRVP